jgi:hypothetical protein
VSGVALCEDRSREKTAKNPKKTKCSSQQQKEMNYDEPHLAPILWTEPPAGALMAADSL